MYEYRERNRTQQLRGRDGPPLETPALPRRRATVLSVLPAVLLLVLVACAAPATETPAVGTPSPVAHSAATAATPTPGGSSTQPPAPDPRLFETPAPAVPTPDARWDAALTTARQHVRNGNLAASLSGYRQVLSGVDAPAELLLELAQIELASGDAAAARETLRRLPPAPAETPRALLLLANVELALGNWEAALDVIDVTSAPDGLADLVVLVRAAAAAAGGNLAGARGELAQPEMRASTNRLLLERAGELAERLGDPGLAGELYARGAGYQGWAAERSRLMRAAGAAFARAGRAAEAIEQYRALVEVFSWTSAAQQSLAELERLGGATPYHRGLVALGSRRFEAAAEALAEAAAEGAYMEQAARQLRRIEERAAWLVADDAGTAAAYRSFRSRYPDGTYAAEAWFQEGLAYYQAGLLGEALGVWEEAAAAGSADEQARLHLWAGKTLAQLGRDAEARARLQAAADSRPAGYYALRARDLIDGIDGWPGGYSRPGDGEEAERAAAERWLAEWAGPAATVDVAAQTRVRRGLGLLALGYPAEAAAELNSLIAESRDGRFLYQLAEVLAGEGLWSSASRAATRVAALSPGRSVASAPLAVQRLSYPPAYWDLVSAEAERQGLDALLFLALIRQESIYDPFALSIAEARGLTQVIPSTGRGIANALGRHGFAPDDLYQPMVSIEFGAWYLANQLGRFGGDPFRSLAAYNAGAGPIGRWAAADADLFVERIDYPETKSYVRQLYVHHAIYRALAGKR